MTFLLSVLVSGFVLNARGDSLGGLRLDPLLVLVPVLFWHGDSWRLISYPFLPGPSAGFLLNLFLIGWLGTRLERVWSGVALSGYALVCVLGAGGMMVCAWPASCTGMAGAGPLALGFTVAWAWLFRRAPIKLLGWRNVSSTTVALLAAAVTLAGTLSSDGIQATLCVCAGGAAGWGWLAAWNRRPKQTETTVASAQRLGESKR